MGSVPKIRRVVQNIRLDLIDRDPRQPREQFDEKKIRELALSIGQEGLIQLPVVRPNPEAPGRFVIVAGERRIIALKLNHMEFYDFVVYEGMTKSFVLSLVENLHRCNLNPIEQAKGFVRLHDEEGMTWQQVSDLVGMSVAQIHLKKRLLDLPADIQQMVIDDKLPQVHARNLAQYHRGDKSKLIAAALELVAGRDPLELNLVPDSNRADRRIDSKLPSTPEAQLRRALRATWYSRGAFKALSAFLSIPEGRQMTILRALNPSTLNALRSAMFDLEQVSHKFNALFLATSQTPPPPNDPPARIVPRSAETKNVSPRPAGNGHVNGGGAGAGVSYTSKVFAPPLAAPKKEVKICPKCTKPLGEYDVSRGLQRHLDCY